MHRTNGHSEGESNGCMKLSTLTLSLSHRQRVTFSSSFPPPSKDKMSCGTWTKSRTSGNNSNYQPSVTELSVTSSRIKRRHTSSDFNHQMCHLQMKALALSVTKTNYYLDTRIVLPVLPFAFLARRCRCRCRPRPRPRPRLRCRRRPPVSRCRFPSVLFSLSTLALCLKYNYHYHCDRCLHSCCTLSTVSFLRRLCRQSNFESRSEWRWLKWTVKGTKWAQLFKIHWWTLAHG